MFSYEDILNRLLNAGPEGIDKREGSIFHDACAPATAEFANAYMLLSLILDESFADTAEGENLERRTKERGIIRKAATKSIRKAILIGAEVQTGVRFSSDSINYRVSEKLPEENAYKLEAETPGRIGNEYSGVIYPLDYIRGMSSATITDVLIPGEDEESDDELRRRYFQSFNSQAFGGNIADYKEKVDALQGVGGVKVYPAKNGAGTVGLTIINSDYGVPSAELIQQVQTAIDPVATTGEGKGLAPIGHKVTVSGVTEKVINIATTITYASGWNYEEAKTHIENVIDTYFLELSKSWADSETIVVRIAQIETRLLNLDAVLDIANTTLNGETVNVQFAADEIPKRGTVNG